MDFNRSDILKRKKIIAFIFLVIIASSLCFTVQENKATPEYYTLVTIPDTQNLSKFYPEMFNAITQWITDNKETENIVFVAHTGDIVADFNDMAQWDNAVYSMSLLGDMPFSVEAGNHDIGGSRHDYSFFDAYFPASMFEDRDGFGGNYPEGTMGNSYFFFSIGTQNFIFMNVNCTAETGAYEWVNSVLSTYPDKKAIIATHGYIDNDGGLDWEDDVDGVGIWGNIVRQNNNIVMVLCAHNHVAPASYGEVSYTLSIGSNDQIIYNLLAGHFNINGGSSPVDGYLRLYRYYPATDTWQALLYCPALDIWQTDSNYQFEFDYNLNVSKFVVVSSADDCTLRYNEPYFSTTMNSFICGFAASSAKDYSAAARYDSVNIPEDAEIISAHLLLKSQVDSSLTKVNTRLRAEKDAGSIPFSDITDFDARTWTDAYVNWDDVCPWFAGKSYESLNIKPLIDEVKSLGDWQSGDPITILWDDFQQRSYSLWNHQRYASTYDSGNIPPVLYIIWREPSVPPIPPTQIMDINIIINGDIVFHYGGIFDTISIDIEVQ